MEKFTIWKLFALIVVALALVLVSQYLIIRIQDESTSSPPAPPGPVGAETSESTEPVARRAYSFDYSEGLAQPRQDPFVALGSLHEVHAALMADGEMTEADVALNVLEWIDACRWSSFSDQVTGSGRSPIGLSGPATESLREFCADLIDLEMVSVYQAAWEEAAEGARNRFVELEKEDGLDAAIQAAIDAIFSSHSEVEINHAVRTIVIRVGLRSPFPSVSDESAAFLFRAIIPYYASLAFLCDNLGGCQGDHPLVARHCLHLEIHDGCYQPRDMYHAIEQTLTPVQFEVFLSLIAQIRQMRRSLDSGRP